MLALSVVLLSVLDKDDAEKSGIRGERLNVGETGVQLDWCTICYFLEFPQITQTIKTRLITALLRL